MCCSSRMTWTSSCLTVAILFVAAVAAAAPILPAASKLKGDVQSLAGIKRVRLQIDLDSAVLKLRDGAAEGLAKKFRNMLENAGLKFTETDIDAPLLRVAMQTQTAADVPGGVVVVYHVSLTQEVLIERIGKKVTLPTYSLIHATLVPDNRLVRELDRPAGRLVSRLIGQIRLASEAGQ